MTNTRETSGGTAANDGESQDQSLLFRNEGLVSDADVRIDVAENFTRYVAGNDDVSLETSMQGVNGSLAVIRGSRTRTVGDYERVTDDDEMLSVGSSVRETVSGGVRLQALISAEALVGGAYVNTIAGPYLRLAGWVDFLAWGGWAEIDVVRAELSLLMIRSHVGYAHAAGVRMTLAARLVDDFQMRTERFGIFVQSGTTHQDAGMPGGGVHLEA